VLHHDGASFHLDAPLVCFIDHRARGGADLVLGRTAGYSLRRV
jgi:hypothetical protein